MWGCNMKVVGGDKNVQGEEMTLMEPGAILYTPVKF